MAQRCNLSFVWDLVTGKEPSDEPALDADVCREASRLRPAHGINISERPWAFGHRRVVDVEDLHKPRVYTNHPRLAGTWCPVKKPAPTWRLAGDFGRRPG